MLSLLSLYFVNSDWLDWRVPGQAEDRLLNAAWRESFLSKWGFGIYPTPSENELTEMRDLRALLQEIIRQIPEHGVVECNLSRLNIYLGRVPLTRSVSCAGAKPILRLIPAQTGWNEVMAAVAASFVDLLGDDPQRIKICANPECRWVFYDRSRNRTGRWCASICGNLIKVRRFRARQQG